MNPHVARLLIALGLAAPLSACSPGADPAGAPPATAAREASAPSEAAPAPGSAATAIVHHAAPDPAGFDRKAFAGRFAGIAPCADCPGIEVELEVDADGGFRLGERHQGRDLRRATSGTWTIDADGRRLLLDPDTKEGEDRWFGIVSKDEIRALDADGRPAEGRSGYSLRRG